MKLHEKLLANIALSNCNLYFLPIFENDENVAYYVAIHYTKYVGNC